MPKQILIVEDDPVISGMYQTLMTNHGYGVKVATDGEMGLNMALEGHPDLILLDINIPKIDGMTVMHKLREDDWGKRVSIIILTNLDADDERLVSVEEDKPSYYLIKAQTTPEEVLNRVSQILENKKEE